MFVGSIAIPESIATAQLKLDVTPPRSCLYVYNDLIGITYNNLLGLITADFFLLKNDEF